MSHYHIFNSGGRHSSVLKESVNLLVIVISEEYLLTRGIIILRALGLKDVAAGIVRKDIRILLNKFTGMVPLSGNTVFSGRRRRNCVFAASYLLAAEIRSVIVAIRYGMVNFLGSKTVIRIVFHVYSDRTRRFGKIVNNRRSVGG